MYDDDRRHRSHNPQVEILHPAPTQAAVFAALVSLPREEQQEGVLRAVLWCCLTVQPWHLGVSPADETSARHFDGWQTLYNVLLDVIPSGWKIPSVLYRQYHADFVRACISYDPPDMSKAEAQERELIANLVEIAAKYDPPSTPSTPSETTDMDEHEPIREIQIPVQPLADTLRKHPRWLWAPRLAVIVDLPPSDGFPGNRYHAVVLHVAGNGRTLLVYAPPWGAHEVVVENCYPNLADQGNAGILLCRLDPGYKLMRLPTQKYVWTVRDVSDGWRAEGEWPALAVAKTLLGVWARLDHQGHEGVAKHHLTQEVKRRIEKLDTSRIVSVLVVPNPVILGERFLDSISITARRFRGQSLGTGWSRWLPHDSTPRNGPGAVGERQEIEEAVVLRWNDVPNSEGIFGISDQEPPLAGTNLKRFTTIHLALIFEVTGRGRAVFLDDAGAEVLPRSTSAAEGA